MLKHPEINFLTRLPTNLRPTTRECLHLVTRGHFWSRDKDGGHTAVAENLMLRSRKLHSCVFCGVGVTDCEYCGKKNFRHFIYHAALRMIESRHIEFEFSDCAQQTVVYCDC